MTLPRLIRTLSPGLALGFALTIEPPLCAQYSGPPISSGSGPGTGTGMMGGATRNTTGTGLEAGGPGATGTGFESGAGPGQLPSRNPLLPGGNVRAGAVDPRAFPRNVSPSQAVPRGPGVGTTFPDDVTLFPLQRIEQPEGSLNPTELSTVQPSQLRDARLITSPGDRSLALQRIAGAAIFSNQLPVAHDALAEATDAALLEPVPLVRDQRLIAIATKLNSLAEAHLREGKVDLTMLDLSESPSPLPKTDRTVLIRRALVEWQRAAAVASRIANPTYRSEVLYRVIDGEAYGSQTIVNEFPAPEVSPSNNSASSGAPFDGLPDRILQEAAALALRIERPVWRDRALVAIAQAASASKQFKRGLEVSRMIPQPEVRTDALVKIAEAQARRGDPDGATSTYKEAALAVAAIPLDDPRAVLAGVLIDNLISVGRFEDARATIVLYPDTPRRLIALGAIAESQGRRGAGDSARAWIAREVAPQYQSQLYRRVDTGILAAIEQNRSRDLSNRER
jgi:hypothetical protein